MVLLGVGTAVSAVLHLPGGDPTRRSDRARRWPGPPRSTPGGRRSSPGRSPRGNDRRGRRDVPGPRARHLPGHWRGRRCRRRRAPPGGRGRGGCLDPTARPVVVRARPQPPWRSWSPGVSTSPGSCRPWRCSVAVWPGWRRFAVGRRRAGPSTAGTGSEAVPTASEDRPGAPVRVAGGGGDSRWWRPRASSAMLGQPAVRPAGPPGRRHRAPLISDTSAPGRQILTGPDPTDPFMLTIGNRYYLYTSEGTTRSTYRCGPVRPGRGPAPLDVLPHLPAWATGGATWAPDVHQVTGGWALYFTALLRGEPRPTASVPPSRRPPGPFVATDRPFICQLDHRGSIDARVIVDSGRLVMLWKSEDNANPAYQVPTRTATPGSIRNTSVPTVAPCSAGRQDPGSFAAVGRHHRRGAGHGRGLGHLLALLLRQLVLPVVVRDRRCACQSPLGPCADVDPTPFIGSNLQGSGPGEESLFVEAATSGSCTTPSRPMTLAP